MGESYWILVWEGWGIGLNMRNPRFLLRKDCPYQGKELPEGHTKCPACGLFEGHRSFSRDADGIERNSWPNNDKLDDEQIEEKHDLNGRFGECWKIIR